MTYRIGRWLGPVACPNCRQTVTVLMNSFTTEENREEDSELKNTILLEVLNYNRRFSGEPRSVSKQAIWKTSDKGVAGAAVLLYVNIKI